MLGGSFLSVAVAHAADRANILDVVNMAVNAVENAGSLVDSIQL